MFTLNKLKKLLIRFSHLVNGFDKKIKFSQRENYLYYSALTNSEQLTSKKMNQDNELIVSLTTYNKRIHDVHLVIESIALQTLKPNRLILWLDEMEFSIETIPLVLKKQMERGLEIRFCPNYKSYKKLIPTLSLFPNADIITIDDDVLYPHDMIELLVKEHHMYPDCIVGHRVHRMRKDNNGSILPYRNWNHGISDSQASHDNVAIGIGGILYPCGCLNSECLNIEAFTNLAPNADDIWFKAMAMLNNRKHKKVEDNRQFDDRFLTIQNLQDIALFNSNLADDQNDNQINQVFYKYNL